MTFDRTARATAGRLIRTFGKSVTLRRLTRTYDPATGKTTDTVEDFAVKVSPPERFREALIDGTLVKAGDLRAHLPAKGLDVVPEPARDRLVIDGKPWSLLCVDPVMSGEQTTFYTLHLRS
ncbi:MAG: hypothetical protein OEU09_23545 [Rhodospirillales bacterium]|nr:hypothetical protein [Rhodospirillales bacterium]MDH3791011.1 hypothetical protein [Rhodospirillales bacterium]MDH3914264.1 hypothetical protein [Rhodospirillales bacterium]MDH3916987.1 hypothetical protein [Rhodospirillales bacterium]